MIVIKNNKFLLKHAALMGAFLVSSPSLGNDFENAVLHAINTHPSILSFKANEGAAKEFVSQEESAYYPSMTLGTAFGRVYSDNTTTRGLSVTRGAGYSWYGEGTASINQSLYDWSATNHGVDAAKTRYHQAGANVENQKNTIALQSAQAYLQLLRSHKLLTAAHDNFDAMQSYYDRIESALNSGGADKSELSRAQDFLSLAKNALVQYESENLIAKANYKEAVGLEPTQKMTDPSVNLRALPKTLDEAMDKALTINPQIAQATLEGRASDFDYRRESVNNLPTLSAELSASMRDQKDLIGGESEDVRGLVRANWLYDFGGGQSAAKKRAAMVSQEMDMNKETVIRTVKRDVEVAWVSLNLSKKQKTHEAERLNAAQKTHETFVEQYEGGQQKILDVMAMGSALFNAQQDYLNAKYQEINAYYQIMTMIGYPFYKDFVNVANAD